jgi:acetyl esterase/lipase
MGWLQPKRILVILSVVILLSGCTARTYNALLSESELNVVRDISYGDHPRQTLDVYHYEPGWEEKKPVIVFVHGGAWDSGHKGKYYFVARSLVDRGYIVVIPNYRLYPDVRFPTFVNDTALAIDWTIDSLHEAVPHSGNIFVAGHSAGAYNAAMVSYDEQYLQAYNSSNESISGFIGLAGLYDFLPITDPEIKPIFSDARSPEETQPVSFVDGDDPPALLIASPEDERVDPANSKALNRVLNQHDVRSELVLLKGGDHVDTVLSLGPYFRSGYKTLTVIDSFVKKISNPSGNENH